MSLCTPERTLCSCYAFALACPLMTIDFLLAFIESLRLHTSFDMSLLSGHSPQQLYSRPILSFLVSKSHSLKSHGAFVGALLSLPRAFLGAFLFQVLIHVIVHTDTANALS